MFLKCPFFVRNLFHKIPAILHRLFDRLKELIIRLERCDFRMIFLDLLRAAEQESRLARLYHSEIIVAVPAGDRLKADGLKCLHRRILGLLDPHLKSRDLPVRSDLQGIAEDRRPAELFHKRFRKLRECVADNDDLTKIASLSKTPRARKRIDLLDRLLNFFQSQSMLL